LLTKLGASGRAASLSKVILYALSLDLGGDHNDQASSPSIVLLNRLSLSNSLSQDKTVIESAILLCVFI